ncbi:hypothetical protein OB976_21530 [Bacillus cereus]|nr:hypothetical protein [Bacillus cereus]
MEFIKIKDEINSSDFLNKNHSFSASMYKSVDIPNKGKKLLAELLDPDCPYEKGIEPGTLNYVKVSPKKMIRTKALKDYSNLISTRGDSVVFIKPKVFNNPNLKSTDILMSKDSNIGESCMIYGDDLEDYTYNSGIVKLNPIVDKFYLYSFLKHPLFKKELEFLTARGSTIKHAGDSFLRCQIPFPTGDNKWEIIECVSNLMQAIVEKELELQNKSKNIIAKIDEELTTDQDEKMPFEYPNIKEINTGGRFDTSLYIPKFKELMGLVENYSLGYTTFSKAGFNVIPGPSLEIKILKTRIDSDHYVEGYYNLILPTNISEHGILNKKKYMGTPKRLPELRYGDVIVGEAGFGKGRSFILMEDMGKCTTNAHGIIIRREEVDIQKSILARSIIYWYREKGLFDLLGVGGSGGHLSPEYFDSILVPCFSTEFLNNLCSLYYNSEDELSLKDILEWDFLEKEKDRNKKLGIVNLKKEIEELKEILSEVQDCIILDKEIHFSVSS